MKKTNEELQEYLKFSKDPLYFIEVMWGLVPQPVKTEYQQIVQDYIAKKQYDEIRGKHFQTFLKGKHITWQQWLFIKAVKDAVNGVGKRRISVASGHGCHAKGTKILMYDGTVKSVEDVVVGDKLMGDDSKPRSVLSLARGKEQLYRVQYFSGEYYDVNESHILSLVASQSHGRQIRGEKQDVYLRDYLEWSDRKKRTNIGYKTSVLFNNDKKSNLLIDPYLLGVWLGDGTSGAGIITNPDEEIAEYIFSIMDAHFNKENSSGCPSISIPGLLKELRVIGVLKNKHIPHEYLTASYNQRMELLAGLLDTDGYNNGGGCFEIIQKRKILAEQIVFLARSVGCHATIKKVSKGCQNNFVGEYWLVIVSRNTWNIPTKILRKKIQKPTKPQREQLNFGFKIVPLEVDNYYGFELDGNGRYLLGDFTVTHNTGKSCTLAMILIWFLYSHYLSQIACTAPSKEQMYDVLWKELSRWISALPPRIKNQFEIQTSHIRIVEKPMEWFARAKTAKKDAPEALAGVHGDDVLLLVDEASGVADEIYETAEGSMTNENYVMILISNPTRLDGKFFKSHNDEIIKHRWQRFTFNSEESPVVEADYCLRKLEENNNNRDADDYRIRVRGIFPRADSVDDKGYTALLTPTDVREIPDVANQDFISPVLMGIDPSGEGSNKTCWVIRDRFKAKIVLREEVSNEKKIAQKTLTLMEVFKVKGDNIWVDGFGVGMNVAKELALAGVSVNGINVGDRCLRERDRETYLNVRAQNYFRLKSWMRSGGELIQDKVWQKQFKSIRYRRALSGKIQIMSKLDMRRAGYNSPDECFIKGTKISTIAGCKNIEDITKNDIVKTPFGYRNVINCGYTGKKITKTISLNNGSTITGTLNHKIYTKNGFRSIDTLVINDIIEVENKLNLFLWKNLSFLIGENIGFRQTNDIISQMFTTGVEKQEEKRSYYTGIFGSSFQEKTSPVVVLSITLMAIIIITILRILKFLASKTTKVIIQILTCLIVNLEGRQSHTWKKLGKCLGIGMRLKKVLLFMRGLGKNRGLEEKQLKRPVSIAEKSSTHFSPEQGFAEENVYGIIGIEEKSMLMKREFVYFVVKNLWRFIVGRTNVVVVGVEQNIEEEKVYNLTVDIDGVFYANNILVSNCDALMLTFTKEDNGGPVRTITGSGQIINHDQGLTLANSQQKENLSVFDAI